MYTVSQKGTWGQCTPISKILLLTDSCRNFVHIHYKDSPPSTRGGAGGAVAQRVERWTSDQQVVGLNPIRGKSCVTTLGNLFTPMCLCHQAL